MSLAAGGRHAYVCNKSESVLSVIEKCLDNGLGTCLIVDDDQRVVGRISMDDIRQALLDGTAIVDPTLGWHLTDTGTTAATRPLRNDIDDAVLQPVLDPSGHLTGVLIDRSTMPVQVAKPQMTHHEFRSVLDAFISCWISSKGPYVQKFEQEFRSFVGVRHGVAVSNGTVALHLALVALGVGPGDEVIVPDLTFAATINAVLYCGATPVIVDVDRETWCMICRIDRARLHGADQGDHSRPSLRAAGGDRPDRRIRQRPWHRRGRGLRGSTRRTLRRTGGRAVRRRLLLLLLCQQDRHHGRGRHVPDQLRGACDLIAAAARSRHVARTVPTGTRGSATIIASPTCRRRSANPSSGASTTRCGAMAASPRSTARRSKVFPTCAFPPPCRTNTSPWSGSPASRCRPTSVCDHACSA